MTDDVQIANRRLDATVNEALIGRTRIKLAEGAMPGPKSSGQDELGLGHG